jgi:hypothetical protein
MAFIEDSRPKTLNLKTTIKVMIFKPCITVPLTKESWIQVHKTNTQFP